MYIDTSNTSSGRVCLNAAKADQLATARTITLSGDASGSVSFDGSKNVTLAVDISALNDINDAIDTKQATITGAATTITSSNLTASRALVSNSSGKVAVSAVTSTELGYLDGVTSNVQTQLNGKADKSQGVLYIEGGGTTDTTNKVATWTGSHSDITKYYAGLMIAYKIGTAGSTTTTLNINNLGAVDVVKNTTTAISTSFPVNSVILLVYTVDGTTAYWKAHDYDANTRNSVGDYRKNGTKLYFVGTTSSDSSSSSSYATSYTNSNIYVDTSNVLNSDQGFKGKLVGNADTADKINTDAGSATQPVYFSNGIPVNTTYTLGASVPSDAKFTDTTYSAAGSALGLVKTGGDVTISSGVITVNDSSHNHSAANITSGTIAAARLPAASGTQAGITIVYPAASCTTFSSDSGTVTPLAVQKGAKMFAITRPSATTVNAVARYSNTTGDVQDSKITIENVTNTRDTSKTANVLVIPAEGNKKMVYGYCTDQVDGTSFIGGVFDADATEYPYAQGLAIGGTSGNLLWKGVKVATTSDIPATLKNPNSLTIKGNGTTSFTYDGSAAKTLNIKGSGSTTVTSDTSGNITISSTGTTYSAGTGLSLSGTTFNNTGVTAISGGSVNGTIAVTIGSSPSEFSVTGLKSAAYTEASNYEVAGAAASAEANAKQYTDTKVAALVNGAPEALNTLQELADALGENTNFATDMATALGNKLDKNASGVISGTSATPLTLKSNGTVSYLAFNNSSNTQLGYIGVNASKVLVYNGNTVYHSGNLGAATTSASGLMTAAMVTKLNSFTEGAEANQNAIAKIKVGSNTITAAAEQDTVTLAGSNGISIAANVTSKTVTISSSGLLPLTAGSGNKISGALGFENNGVMYGTSLPAASSSYEGQLFFLEDDSPALPAGGLANYILVKNSATDGDAKWVQSVAYANALKTARTVTFSGGATGSFSFNGSQNVTCALTLAAHNHTWSQISDRGTLSISTTGTISASKVTGAVWNDYAEYREQEEEIKPGYCVTSSNDGKVRKTTEKFQACDGIVSDTFGFSIGETDKSKTPLAVAGRVLAHCEGSRYNYNAGDTVCAGPDGRVVKMTREEIREWPDRIVGIVSEVPEYKTWGTDNILVDDRIWIKVK